MAKLFSGLIENCYDSHVHWLGTGQFASRIRLHELRNPERDLPLLSISPTQKNRPWLVGFGWDQNLFMDDDSAGAANKKFPTHETLDRYFADKPVYFLRIDGHAAWVNRRALELAGLWRKNPEVPAGGAILLKADGYPTGVVLDHALQLFEKLLPKASAIQVKADLLEAQNIFLRAGFTHIRDMSCDDLQWAAACELEAQGQLNLAVEQFFSADDPITFDEQLRKAVAHRAERAHTPQALLQVAGVKVYLDGALGSEGAWLSQAYQTSQSSALANAANFGLQLLTPEALQDFIEKAWLKEMPIAIHTIGDEAAHCAVTSALKIREQKGLNGVLHLEHAELLRPETIALMPRLKVTCHMQPCHFLSDRRWLKEKLGPLARHAFQWRALEQSSVNIAMGSDSPIEPPSLQRNIDAVALAADEGLLAPQTSISKCHAHPNHQWAPKTRTRFEDGAAAEVWFRGDKII